MTIQLENGRFFGQPIVERSTEHLDLVLTAYESGLRLPVHAHERPYLALVVSGGFQEKVGAGEHACRSGSLLLNTVGAEHSDSFLAERSEVLNVELAPEWLAGLRADGWREERPAWLDHVPARRAILGLRRELARPDSLSGFVLEGLVAELLGLAARSAHPRRPSTSRAPSWLAEVERELAERFRRPPSLTELAQLARVGPAHLARVFRARHGSSVGAWARALRDEHAHELVVRTRRELAEIALDSGYTDQSHMTRRFRRRYGCTPGALRAERSTAGKPPR